MDQRPEPNAIVLMPGQHAASSTSTAPGGGDAFVDTQLGRRTVGTFDQTMIVDHAPGWTIHFPTTSEAAASEGRMAVKRETPRAPRCAGVIALPRLPVLISSGSPCPADAARCPRPRRGLRRPAGVVSLGPSRRGPHAGGGQRPTATESKRGQGPAPLTPPGAPCPGPGSRSERRGLAPASSSTERVPRDQPSRGRGRLVDRGDAVGWPELLRQAGGERPRDRPGAPEDRGSGLPSIPLGASSASSRRAVMAIGNRSGSTTR